jgi:hypothetical protein
VQEDYLIRQKEKEILRLLSQEEEENDTRNLNTGKGPL